MSLWHLYFNKISLYLQSIIIGHPHTVTTTLGQIGPVDKMPYENWQSSIGQQKGRPLASFRVSYHPLQVQSGHRKETEALRCLKTMP